MLQKSRSGAERRELRVADAEPVNVANALREAHAEILLCYMPVGSEKAVQHYAQACLDAQVAMVKSWAAENAKIGPRVIVAEPKPLATVMRTRFFPGEDRSQLASADAEAARILTEAGLV